MATYKKIFGCNPDVFGFPASQASFDGCTVSNGGSMPIPPTKLYPFAFSRCYLKKCMQDLAC
jgi:hypothetical protein